MLAPTSSETPVGLIKNFLTTSRFSSGLKGGAAGPGPAAPIETTGLVSGLPDQVPGAGSGKVIGASGLTSILPGKAPGIPP